MIVVGYGECSSCQRLVPVYMHEDDGSLAFESPHPNPQGEKCKSFTTPEGADAPKEVLHVVSFYGGWSTFSVRRYRFAKRDGRLIGWVEAQGPPVANVGEAVTLADILNDDPNTLPLADSTPTQLYVVLKWSGIEEHWYDVVEKRDFDRQMSVLCYPYRNSRTVLSKLNFQTACAIANNANTNAMAIR